MSTNVKKFLYRLRKASRNWYINFTDALLSIGFQHSKVDHWLLIFTKQTVFYVFALIYVDDVHLFGNGIDCGTKIKSFLDERFSIKDLVPLKFFLALKQQEHWMRGTYPTQVHFGYTSRLWSSRHST